MEEFLEEMNIPVPTAKDVIRRLRHEIFTLKQILARKNNIVKKQTDAFRKARGVSNMYRAVADTLKSTAANLEQRLEQANKDIVSLRADNGNKQKQLEEATNTIQSLQATIKQQRGNNEAFNLNDFEDIEAEECDDEEDEDEEEEYEDEDMQIEDEEDEEAEGVQDEDEKASDSDDDYVPPAKHKIERNEVDYGLLVANQEGIIDYDVEDIQFVANHKINNKSEADNSSDEELHGFDEELSDFDKVSSHSNSDEEPAAEENEIAKNEQLIKWEQAVYANPAVVCDEDNNHNKIVEAEEIEEKQAEHIN